MRLGYRFTIIMCESYLASGDKPVKHNANAESQHTKPNE
jgi:hypothetical protein